MLNKCGVYKITNKINKKAYIGCSSNIKRRWTVHKSVYKSTSNKEYQKELYIDMRKYGLDKHSGAKLSILDVEDIRTRYNNLERKQDVYDDYSHLINKTGFHKIWNGYTWKNIMPEVYTDENKAYHKNNTANKGSNNGKAAIKEQDVIDIRTRKKEGETKKDVYKDYETVLSFKSFENIWYNCNWKHIVI